MIVGDHVELLYCFKQSGLPKVGEKGIIREVAPLGEGGFMYRVEWKDTKLEGSRKHLKLLLQPVNFKRVEALESEAWYRRVISWVKSLFG